MHAVDEYDACEGYGGGYEDMRKRGRRVTRRNGMEADGRRMTKMRRRMIGWDGKLNEERKEGLARDEG